MEEDYQGEGYQDEDKSDEPKPYSFSKDDEDTE